MGPGPKHSTFGDRSHVMRDRSNLFGTVTPITGSYGPYEINMQADYVRGVLLQLKLGLCLRAQMCWTRSSENLLQMAAEPNQTWPKSFKLRNYINLICA